MPSIIIYTVFIFDTEPSVSESHSIWPHFSFSLFTLSRKRKRLFNGCIIPERCYAAILVLYDASCRLPAHLEIQRRLRLYRFTLVQCPMLTADSFAMISSMVVELSAAFFCQLLPIRQQFFMNCLNIFKKEFYNSARYSVIKPIYIIHFFIKIFKLSMNSLLLIFNST